MSAAQTGGLLLERQFDAGNVLVHGSHPNESRNHSLAHAQNKRVKLILILLIILLSILLQLTVKIQRLEDPAICPWILTRKCFSCRVTQVDLDGRICFRKRLKNRDTIKRQ